MKILGFMTGTSLDAVDMAVLETELDDRVREGDRLKNNLRYAWFADSGCLAVEHDGTLSLLDARSHPINGIAQASGNAEVMFSTPEGTVSLSSLPPFSPKGPSPTSAPAPAPARPHRAGRRGRRRRNSSE